MPGGHGAGAHSGTGGASGGAGMPGGHGADSAGAGAGTGGGTGGGSGGSSTLVEIDSGLVQGKISGGVRAFLGIPYADAPVGALRWKSPQPASSWSETLEATQFGPLCPQPSPLGSSVVSGTSEDCLSLNVWAPDAEPASASPAPVMVWIHGGGFSMGGGSESAYLGEKLVAATGVVVVSLNYRLGPLGFLAHPALTAEGPVAPSFGNYGLEDQRLALDWVRRNVAAFDGDSTNVTLFGESAGGFSVCSHQVSSGSSGLFHRAIMQSGPCHSRFPTLAQAEAQGVDLATALGCDASPDPLACLRDAAADDTLLALPPDQTFILGEGVSWFPVIDGVMLPDQPSVLVERDEFQTVPTLIGSNKDEMTFFIALGQLEAISDEDYRQYVANLMGAQAAAVLAEYPATDYSSPAIALSTLMGELVFNCPSRATARAMARSGADVYLYHFVHEAEGTLFPGKMGAFHGSEIPFVFDTDWFGAGPTPETRPLSDAMMGYWTRFAQTGDPNAVGAVSWPLFQRASDPHLELGLPIASSDRLREAKCNFWDSLVAEP